MVDFFVKNSRVFLDCNFCGLEQGGALCGPLAALRSFLCGPPPYLYSENKIKPIVKISFFKIFSRQFCYKIHVFNTKSIDK